jgi:hypothetical protein
MAISLPRSLVEYVLLGPAGDRRQLQDSPILGDVWIAFAKDPAKPQELLVTPHRAQTAGLVAAEIDRLIERGPDDPADIAYLQGIIAARLRFAEVLTIIVPMTDWWQSPRIWKDLRTYLEGEGGSRRIEWLVDIVRRMAAHWSAPARYPRVDEYLSAFDRYAALAGLILWASGNEAQTKKRGFASVEGAIAAAIRDGVNRIADCLKNSFHEIRDRFPVESRRKRAPLVFQISLNREATLALTRSVPAVKADAARTLFSVKCSEIAWAVIDSGINGRHAAFKGPDGESRVKSSFDFSNIRKIVSLDNLRILGRSAQNEEKRAERLKEVLHDNLKERLSPDHAVELLTSLAEDAVSRRPVHWEFVRPFVEIDVETPPRVSDHGTHVAGILGANRAGADDLPEDLRSDYADGMCPDIRLYDFRVLAPTVRETEFAIIAALQYIRYMNQRHDYLTIHGVNLSLSIPHDVRNYACGRTPVCLECERLVDSGVVVVAAAGNLGYQSFETKEGSYEGYAAFSVTDPGNADGVITVGATHRYSPHTYGVSFFSSRGPTGDGRLKPDLVAPGERIRAPFREGWGDLDGTSMAAPPVSGAAAMLMARYSELIGQPRRIKCILCQSATDLGRERSFQGHGMLDVLRAFQSL